MATDGARQRKGDDPATAFGARLKELADERGWTQAKVSQVAGIDSGAVSRHFERVKPPSAKSIAAYSRAFQVSADFLVSGRGRRGVGTEEMTAWERALDSFEWPDVSLELIDHVLTVVRAEGPKHPERPERVWYVRIRQLLKSAKVSSTHPIPGTRQGRAQDQ